MMRSTVSPSNKSISEYMQSSGIFNSSKKQKPLQEEQMLVDVYRKLFEEQKEKLRETLGSDYTDEIAEEIFQKSIEALKQNGTFKELLDQYLQAKIERERAKFTGKK